MSKDLGGMWIQENLLKARGEYKRAEEAYNALQGKETQYAKGMKKLLEIKGKVVALWKEESKC